MKKFTMLMAAGLVAMTASAADVYLIGGFNNWTESDPNCKFTEVSETEYVLDYVGNLTSGFKLNDGTWANDDANWGSNGSDLVIGEAYVCSVGGTTGNIMLSEAVENPHLVFDPTTGTLTITGAAADVTVSYDIWGNLDGGIEWYSTALTKQADGTWTGSASVAADSNFGIRLLNDGVQADWISKDAEEGYVEFSTPMACKIEGVNFAFAEAADVTFTFNPEAMTLTVVKGGDVPPVVSEYPEQMWVMGSFTSWSFEQAIEMNNEGDGKYTAVIEGPFSGYEGDGKTMFRFLAALDWAEETSYGAALYDGDDIEVSLNEAGGTNGEWHGDVIKGGKGNWWFNAEEMGDHKLVINLDLATLKVQFGTDNVVDPNVGVEAINVVAGEVMYFNLQGARVANPESGLYIRIENGKAQKVLVK
ncbi:MAG: hypothetical protein HDS26_00910 [Bacteroides sp.]|nr:hypothetical protein [Bacteroides sp.]